MLILLSIIGLFYIAYITDMINDAQKSVNNVKTKIDETIKSYYKIQQKSKIAY